MADGEGIRLPNFPDATGFSDTDFVFMTQDEATVKGTVAQLRDAVATNATRETFLAGPNFTGSISGAVLTVIAFASGAPMAVGQTVFGAGVNAGQTILSFGTGTGGPGTYNLSAAQSSVTSEPMGAASATQFAPGFSASITLAGTYGSINNIIVAFDAGPQFDCTLNGQTLGFNPTVPAGIQAVNIIGGTARTIGVPADASVTDAKVAPSSKLYNRISTIRVDDYPGLDPTGVGDSTAAFTAAANAAALVANCREVIIPAGIFSTNVVTWPSKTKVCGEGRATVIQPITGFSGTAFWQTANGGSGIEVSDFEMRVPVGTFPSVIPIYANPGDDIYIHDIYMAGGGSIGVYTNNLTNSLIERVQVMGAVTVGILGDGSGSINNAIRECHVENVSVSHGIAMQLGTKHQISNCTSINAAGFGITMQGCTHSQIYSNRVKNSHLESITAGGDGGSDLDVYDNNANWDPGVSTDFGMSTSAGGSVGAFRIRFRGNSINGCGKSGIAFASDATSGWSLIQCEASDNVIIDSNQLGLGPVNGGGAGILFYGSFCTGNMAKNNTIIDTGAGKLNYGIFETQIGTGGFPSHNKYFNNKIYGQTGAKVVKLGHSTEAFCQDSELGYLSWSPTITANSGTLGAVTLNNAIYYEMEGRVDFYISASITSNGSGAGTVNFTLPFPATVGFANGRESGLSGKQIVGSVSGSSVAVRTYDNLYPGGTGAVVELMGTFFRTF